MNSQRGQEHADDERDKQENADPQHDRKREEAVMQESEERSPWLYDHTPDCVQQILQLCEYCGCAEEQQRRAEDSRPHAEGRRHLRVDREIHRWQLHRAFPHAWPESDGRKLHATYPDGITAEHFYEKNAPKHTPPLVNRFAVPRSEGGPDINYVLCDDRATLVWATNLGDIEKHVLLAQG